jgi:hypothetical protein
MSGLKVSREYMPFLPRQSTREPAGRFLPRNLPADRKRALKIVRRLDQSRIDAHGGYPSCVRFINDYVAIASIAGDREPELTVMPITDFIREWQQEMEEWED